MFIYLLIGTLVTFFFDIVLRGGEHELNNLERIFIFVTWPIMLLWFVYHLINEFRKSDKWNSK